MDPFEFIEWNKEKNEKLLSERGVNFDHVVKALKEGKKVAIIDHPNPTRYPNQQILMIWINAYVYAVPFVRKDVNIAFFKTLYPSRKLTKKYKKKEET